MFIVQDRENYISLHFALLYFSEAVFLRFSYQFLLFIFKYLICFFLFIMIYIYMFVFFKFIYHDLYLLCCCGMRSNRNLRALIRRTDMIKFVKSILLYILLIGLQKLFLRFFPINSCLLFSNVYLFFFFSIIIVYNDLYLQVSRNKR